MFSIAVHLQGDYRGREVIALEEDVTNVELRYRIHVLSVNLRIIIYRSYNIMNIYGLSGEFS